MFSDNIYKWIAIQFRMWPIIWHEWEEIIGQKSSFFDCHIIFQSIRKKEELQSSAKNIQKAFIAVFHVLQSFILSRHILPFF